ncbi:MAG: FecR domain-containing protein [Verrucomicrobiae bacterium]|nr:FecR domain-containing protein [Verrucomicrobiae bacterium]
MKDEERIDRALDGQLSPKEWEALQTAVIHDAALRQLYVERALLHGQLRAERELLTRLIEDDFAPIALSRPRFWLPAAWAAAAAIVTGLIVFHLRPVNPIETVATLAEAKGCKWAGSDLPTSEGSRLGAGRLALVEGMATLKFESGATITLEAPSTLHVLSKMHCRLIEGSLVADVPESAHGFTVDTDNMQVVDFGTRFGVTANTFGNSQVLVFEGEVEVNRNGHDARRLTTGNAVHVGDPPPHDQEVTRSTPTGESRDGWLTATTATGRGKDAYVRRGDAHGPTGAHPLLMVKHTELAANNERRIFLTFDLSNMPLRNAVEAELTLDVEPSGLGFSALVPDSRFSVYGLLDDSLDNWAESEVIWNGAPASLDGGLDLQSVTKLADFEIRRGAPPARVIISSAELLQFLRSDRNSLATLILIRETGEFDRQGLVHAFASKEHPRAFPPTLRVKPAEHP